MAFSKKFNTNGCRSCIICLRNYNSQSTNADKDTVWKISSIQGQLKTMTANQWKLITHLKDQLSKPTDVMLILNKEWTNLLKKLPSVTGQIPAPTLKRGFKETLSFESDKCNVANVNQSSPLANNVLGDIGYGLSPLINDLRARLSQKAVTNDVNDEKIRWKTQKPNVSNMSIASRTKYVLSSVSSAESSSSKLKRLDDLIDHLIQYPEAINFAVKDGAIRKLLILRKKTKDTSSLGAIREALTILGYVDPLPRKGIRILSIDGGGIRGLLVIEMLRKLEELTGRKVYEMFDYICGVSTGSVIACTIGTSNKTLDEISSLYKLLSNQIFTQNAFSGTRSLLWSHAYYDTAMWESLLKDHVGHTQMIKTSRNPNCPKIGAVSTVVNQGKVLAFVFRNYGMPFRIRSQYMGSYKYELWEASRASAAAPAYFEEFRLGDLLHQDGGVLVNNPTAVALHEAKQLWPDSPIQCVVSFGTGRVSPVMHSNDSKEITKGSSWTEKFYKILDSATDTEAVHTMLNDLLPGSVYYRFNPYLTEMLSMVEYQPEKLKQLEQDAVMYIRRNEEKFEEAAATLMEPRSYTQQSKDWLALQSVYLGVK